MVASVKEGKFEVNNVNDTFYTSIYSVEKKNLKKTKWFVIDGQTNQPAYLPYIIFLKSVHSLIGFLSALSYSVGIWMTLFFSAFCLC